MGSRQERLENRQLKHTGSMSRAPDPRYAGKIRTRVNGLLIHDQSLLMVQLHSPVTGGLIWMPPGGGVQFGEALTGTLCREMAEETGLTVSAGPLWYLHEVVTPHVHAIEFYFRCDWQHGELQKGMDPEYSRQEQIIRDVDWIPLKQLNREDVHPLYLKTNLLNDWQAEKKGGMTTPPGLPRFI